MTLRETIFKDATSFFHRFATLSEEEAVDTARRIWHDINGLNLHENIEPTRRPSAESSRNSTMAVSTVLSSTMAR